MSAICECHPQQCLDSGRKGGERRHKKHILIDALLKDREGFAGGYSNHNSHEKDVVALEIRDQDPQMSFLLTNVHSGLHSNAQSLTQNGSH